MELTRSLVKAKAREYRETEPLSAVEEEHVELLPKTLRDGQYGWRDAEWVIQWYYRRYLGAYPDDRRRAAEEAFRGNDFEDVRNALAEALDRDGIAGKLRRLEVLDGVDIPVASAFLMFAFPKRYVVLGDREWTVLKQASLLQKPYPDPPSVEEYMTYQRCCQGLLQRFDVDAWTLYRALWRLHAEPPDPPRNDRP